MGLFSRKGNDDHRFERDEWDVQEQVKEQASHWRRVREVHNEREFARPMKGTRPTSGPSSDDANTPKRGRRW
ncbi:MULTISPECIES: hypothetical protein [unclassified Streptomyces]|uniref:hypothetical protein n=1 Tax=unclassified Streptomyces TaxID=2593676 RepID=UPI00364DCC35